MERFDIPVSCRAGHFHDFDECIGGPTGSDPVNDIENCQHLEAVRLFTKISRQVLIPLADVEHAAVEPAAGASKQPLSLLTL